MRPRHSKRRQAALAAGYRSGLEKEVAEDLKKRGILFSYEATKISYNRPVRAGSCNKCASRDVGKRSVYTPDFHITTSDGRILEIETKGRFVASDRAKLKLIREQHPSLDIRLVFAADNWTTKLKRERYTDWAKRNGFVCHVGKTIPETWITDRSASPQESPAVVGPSEVLSGRTRGCRSRQLPRKRAAQPRKAVALGSK